MSNKNKYFNLYQRVRFKKNAWLKGKYFANNLTDYSLGKELNLNFGKSIKTKIKLTLDGLIIGEKPLPIFKFKQASIYELINLNDIIDLYQDKQLLNVLVCIFRSTLDNFKYEIYAFQLEKIDDVKEYEELFQRIVSRNSSIAYNYSNHSNLNNEIYKPNVYSYTMRMKNKNDVPQISKFQTIDKKPFIKSVESNLYNIKHEQLHPAPTFKNFDDSYNEGSFFKDNNSPSLTFTRSLGLQITIDESLNWHDKLELDLFMHRDKSIYYEGNQYSSVYCQVNPIISQDSTDLKYSPNFKKSKLISNDEWDNYLVVKVQPADIQILPVEKKNHESKLINKNSSDFYSKFKINQILKKPSSSNTSIVNFSQGNISKEPPNINFIQNDIKSKNLIKQNYSQINNLIIKNKRFSSDSGINYETDSKKEHIISNINYNNNSEYITENEPYPQTKYYKGFQLNPISNSSSRLSLNRINLELSDSRQKQQNSKTASSQIMTSKSNDKYYIIQNNLPRSRLSLASTRKSGSITGISYPVVNLNPHGSNQNTLEKKHKRNELHSYKSSVNKLPDIFESNLNLNSPINMKQSPGHKLNLRASPSSIYHPNSNWHRK